MYNSLLCYILARVYALCRSAHHVPPPLLRASVSYLPPASNHASAHALYAALPPQTTAILAAALSSAAATLCIITSGACTHAFSLYTRFTSCGAAWLDHQASLTRLLLVIQKKSQQPHSEGMGQPSCSKAPSGWLLWAASKYPYSHTLRAEKISDIDCNFCQHATKNGQPFM